MCQAATQAGPIGVPIFVFLMLSLGIFFGYACYRVKKAEPDYSRFARGLRRIRDAEREMDPTAPSVLRLLKQDEPSLKRIPWRQGPAAIARTLYED